MSNLLDHYRNIITGYKIAVVDDLKEKLFGDKSQNTEKNNDTQNSYTTKEPEYTKFLEKSARALFGIGFGFVYASEAINYLINSPLYKKKKAIQNELPFDAKKAKEDYKILIENIENVWDVLIKYKNGVPDIKYYIELDFNEKISEHPVWYHIDGLLLTKGTPASAIREIVLNKDKWQVDCAMHIQLIQHYAALLCYGDEKYNTIFLNQQTKKYKLEMLFFESTGFFKNTKETIVSDDGKNFENELSKKKIEVKNEKELLDMIPTGCNITFESTKRIDGSAWNAENVIKIGRDMYSAHGLETLFFTYNILRAKLDEEAKTFKDGRKYLITEINYIDFSL